MAGEDAAGAAGNEGQGAGQGAGEPSWTAALPEGVRGYAELKGWKEPGQVVESYQNLEKLQRTPRERLLTLPEKEDAPEWAEVFGRLGRPEKPEGYEIDGADPELLAALHKEGISKRAAKNLATLISSRAQAATQRQTEATQQEVQLAESALKTEWGGEYDANMRHGKTAVGAIFKDLGFPPEKVADFLDAMQESMVKVGHKPGEAYSAVMKTFARWGRGMGESTFVEGSDRGGQGFGMTPAAAKAKFDQLSSDVAFMTKLQSGDKAAQAEFSRYAELAAQGMTAGGPPR